MKCMIQERSTGYLKSWQRFLFILAIGLLLSISQASAYIDPGVASVAWQFVLSVLLASLYVVHQYWTRIKRLFRKKIGKSSN